MIPAILDSEDAVSTEEKIRAMKELTNQETIHFGYLFTNPRRLYSRQDLIFRNSCIYSNFDQIKGNSVDKFEMKWKKLES